MISTKKKLALGSFLTSTAGTGIILASIFGWSGSPRPWGFVLGFVLGILTGLGTTFIIAGLIEHRRQR